MVMTQIKSLQTGIKFKDTPIGKIPVDWEVRKLGELSENITKGTTPTTYGHHYQENGVSFLRVENITENGKINSNDIKYILPETHEFLSRSKLEEGDILFSIAGAIGRCALVTDNILPANINQAIALIRIKSKSIVNLQFVLQMLLSKSIKNQSALEATSLAQTNLNLEQIKNLVVPLPSLPEQNKISEILTTVDDAIEETDAIIENTRELKKGLMQKLLTRGIGHKKFKKTGIGEIPEGWKVVTLKDVSSPERHSFVDGLFGSNLKTIHYRTSGVPVIQSQMVISGTFTPLNKFYVSDEKAKELERSKVKAGDIVIAKIGVNFGASATVPDEYPDAVLSGNTMKITPDKSKIATQYLQYLLHFYREKKIFDKIVSITAQPAITLAGVRNLLIPLPDKKEQKEITDALTSLDLELDNEQGCSQQLSILKKSLMQVLLTGRVRVKLH